MRAFLRYPFAFASFRRLVREVGADGQPFGNPARNGARCSAWVERTR